MGTWPHRTVHEPVPATDVGHPRIHLWVQAVRWPSMRPVGAAVLMPPSLEAQRRSHLTPAIASIEICQRLPVVTSAQPARSRASCPQHRAARPRTPPIMPNCPGILPSRRLAHATPCRRPSQILAADKRTAPVRAGSWGRHSTGCLGGKGVPVVMTQLRMARSVPGGLRRRNGHHVTYPSYRLARVVPRPSRTCSLELVT